MDNFVETDFHTKADIDNDFRRLDEILNSNIFSTANARNPLFQSAFLETLVRTRDLMRKAEVLVSRISFDDDVIKTEQVKDVTDLITYVRDAMCHPESDKHFLEPRNIKFAFCVSFGKGTLAKIGDLEIKSEHADDTAFFFGPQRIYLKRHIIRCIGEARTKLAIVKVKK